MAFFIGKLTEAAGEHDYDKLTAIDWFHEDFVTGFKQTGWWDNHRKIHRHHLAQEDGVPEDVNLLDVLEYISDCVMAGMARSGSVYDLTMPPELLERAFKNTVELLKAEVVISDANSVISTALRLAQKRIFVEAKSLMVSQTIESQRVACLSLMVDDLGSLMK